jgi:hypothetical protein
MKRPKPKAPPKAPAALLRGSGQRGEGSGRWRDACADGAALLAATEECARDVAGATRDARPFSRDELTTACAGYPGTTREPPFARSIDGA